MGQTQSLWQVSPRLQYGILMLVHLMLVLTSLAVGIDLMVHDSWGTDGLLYGSLAALALWFFTGLLEYEFYRTRGPRSLQSRTSDFLWHVLWFIGLLCIGGGIAMGIVVGVNYSPRHMGIGLFVSWIVALFMSMINYPGVYVGVQNLTYRWTEATLSYRK